jgi:hypothetical protein
VHSLPLIPLLYVYRENPRKSYVWEKSAEVFTFSYSSTMKRGTVKLFMILRLG